jgi:hypothetical protein
MFGLAEGYAAGRRTENELPPESNDSFMGYGMNLTKTNMQDIVRALKLNALIPGGPWNVIPRR